MDGATTKRTSVPGTLSLGIVIGRCAARGAWLLTTTRSLR